MSNGTNETVDIRWHPDCFLLDAGEGCYEYESDPFMAVNEPHPETAERLINLKFDPRKSTAQESLQLVPGSPSEH